MIVGIGCQKCKRVMDRRGIPVPETNYTINSKKAARFWTKEKADKVAKKNGWKVPDDVNGSEHICPDCGRLGEALANSTK